MPEPWGRTRPRFFHFSENIRPSIVEEVLRPLCGPDWSWLKQSNPREGEKIMRHSSFVFLGMLALFCASASGQTLIGVNGGSLERDLGFESPGAVLSIDQTTGAGTVLATPMPGLGVTGVATDSLGRVFASTGTTGSATDGPRLIRIDPATGALLADVGRLQTAGGDDCYIVDLSFQPGTNVLFGILGNQGPAPRCGIEGSPGGYLLTINTATAQVTVIGRDAALGNSGGGLAFAPNGTLYFTPCWSNDGFIHTLNPATAAITSSTVLVDSGTCYMGLAVRPTDGTIFASYDWENEDNRIFILDPVTGARQAVGSPGNYLVHDLTFVAGGSLSQEEGTIGTEITIEGSGFGAKKGKVYLGAVALKVLVWGNEMIQCVISKPLSPSSYDITIRPKGAAEILLQDAFSVEAPRIDSINPIQGSQGTEVTIFGDFFGSKKGKVTLGGENCKVLSWAMSEILIEVPKGLTPGTYELTVTNQVGSDTMEGAFTIP